MTTTPLMGLVLPTDHGSADIWDTIQDTIFATIDSHNHTTGQGAKIPTAALTIDGDVSWSTGGVSRSITDLVALDFKASPAASVVGFAGCLFVSDGTGGLTANELYWRTTTGTNVKLTAGAALNVASFTGGIGGDYAATGALVVFDDATDSYWFQQQVGASVRQYARMRSADVDLYEFKANPAAGVPTNRVRLASPTALGASYALTMPGALPANSGYLRVDTAGLLTVAAPLIYSASSMRGVDGGTGVFNDSGAGGQTWIFGAAATIVGDAHMIVGTTITSWSIFINKQSNAGVTLTAKMFEYNKLTGLGTQIGATQTNSAVTPGFTTIGQSGLSFAVVANRTYGVTIANSANAPSDSVLGFTVAT